MEKKITNMVFKKVLQSSPYHVNGEFSSNGHWLVRNDWALSLKKRRELGMIGFINRITRGVTQFAVDRLQGREVLDPGFERLLDAVNLADYKPLNLSKIKPVMGYRKNDLENQQVVSVNFGKNTPTLDVEYAPLCFFDSESETHFKDRYSPIVILKHGEIVAMLMPLRPSN